jgi:hypothetical protein
MSAEQGDPGRPSLATRLREKLPEILIEAASVVGAVLLALAIDAWREEHRESARAEALLAAVEDEIRSNRAELNRVLAVTAENRKRLSVLLALADDPAAEASHEARLDLALLSEAAWHTAQAGGTIARMAPGEAIRMAKVYELQSLFRDAQQRIVDAAFVTTVQSAESDPVALRRALRELDSRLLLGEQLGAALEEAIAEVLGDAPPVNRSEVSGDGR